jgi:hypothetical protein
MSLRMNIDAGSRRALGALGVFAIACLSIAPAFGQCGSLPAPSDTAVASGGNFNVAGTWVTNTGATVVPNSTYNTCIVNGTLASPGTVYMVSTNSGSVLNLQVGANNTLSLTSFTGLGVYGTQIINNGSINLTAAGGYEAGLSLNASTTLSGAGTLTLSSTTGGAAVLGDALNSSVTLTNASNIVGGGDIGGVNNYLVFSNSGTVNANASGQTLALYTAAGAATNTGLMAASNGGTLELYSTVINNAGGNITANNGSTVTLVDATINGGTLNSSGSGTLQTPYGSSAALNGVTLSTGTDYINNADATLSVSGTITNNGTIQINANGGAGSTLLLTGNTTLTGGTVSLSYNNTLYNDASIGTNTAGLTLTNSSTSTIQGAGNISGVALSNNGTVNANSAGFTLILASATTNTGLLEATNGGTLQLSSAINNAGGNITANGGTVDVSTTITGGTLNALNGGILQIVADSGATLNGVTISAGTTFITSNDSSLSVSGTITNNGVILLNGAAGGGNSILDLNANTTLSGGTLTMTEVTNSGFAAIIQGAVAGLTLTNSGVIQGAGVIGNGGSFTLSNSGTVNANSSGQTLTLNPNSLGGVTNTGLLEATNGGTLQISTVVNNAGGNITANGGAVLSNSTIQGGTLNTMNGGTMGTNPGGVSTLDGSTHGALTISAGSTYSNGNASYVVTLGTITNNGTIQLTAAGNNSIFDLSANTTLNGNGTVTLASTGAGYAIIQQEVGGLTLTNAGNTIQGAGIIGNGGLTIVNGAGGTILANVSGGTLYINGTGGLTNNGTLQVDAGSTLRVTSPITNFSGTTLTGGTYIVAGTLEIDALGTTGGEIVHNAADIILSGAGYSFVDANGRNALSAFSTNLAAGSFTLENGANFTTLGAFSNSGVMDIEAGDLFSVNGVFTQSGGTTQVDGTLTASSITVNGGLLEGTGQLNGSLTVNGGEVKPGDSPGEVTVNGSYTEATTGDLLIQIASLSAFDILDVNGQANLGGTVSFDALGGFTAAAGETFLFLDYDSLNGSFSTVDLSGLNLTAGLTAEVLYGVGNGDQAELLINGPITSQTPEPSALFLFAGGLGMLAAVRFARKRRADPVAREK